MPLSQLNDVAALIIFDQQKQNDYVLGYGGGSWPALPQGLLLTVAQPFICHIQGEEQ